MINVLNVNVTGQRVNIGLQSIKYVLGKFWVVRKNERKNLQRFCKINIHFKGEKGAVINFNI